MPSFTRVGRGAGSVRDREPIGIRQVAEAITPRQDQARNPRDAARLDHSADPADLKFGRIFPLDQKWVTHSKTGVSSRRDLKGTCDQSMTTPRSSDDGSAAS